MSPPLSQASRCAPHPASPISAAFPVADMPLCQNRDGPTLSTLYPPNWLRRLSNTSDTHPTNLAGGGAPGPSASASAGGVAGSAGPIWPPV